MQIPRIRMKVWVLLLLPPVTGLLMIAVDRLTARPAFFCYGPVFEFDVVDSRDKHPIKATVTRTYFGRLAGEEDPVDTFTTSGWRYGKYRGMSRERFYGGTSCLVLYLPRTLFLRRRDLWMTEGTRFTIEAEGYDPFEFLPVDREGKPLAFDSPHIPVFRIELRPVGMPEVPASWSTRPELETDTEFLNRINRGAAVR